MNAARIRVIICGMCIVVMSSGCTFSLQGPPSPGPSPSPVETSAPSPSPSALASDLGTPSGATPPADRSRQIQLLEGQVSLLRGLRPSTEIPLRLLSPDRLRREALDECLAQRPEEALNLQTLKMLGLIQRDIDLDATYTTLAENWANSLTSRHDDPSGAIALADTPVLDATSRLDYIASYLSALRAAAFKGGPTRACCPTACASEDDAGLALAAFVLGEERLAQEQWVRIFGVAQDAAQLATLVDPNREAGLSGAPPFLKSAFDFVLTGGRAFVQRLYISGGWSAVDSAYAEPPSSTEQILHPERYPEDVPLPLQIPDLSGALGPEWAPAQMTTLGEWRMRRTLQAVLPADEAADAATNWGNDVLLTYHNRALDRDLLVLITRWDNLRQAQDFALAFRAYGEARFGERRPTAQADTWSWEDGFTLLERASDQTLWILAPDEATAQAARAGLTFPAPER